MIFLNICVQQIGILFFPSAEMLDNWRNSINLTETESTTTAIENMESVWNYYVSEVTGMYAQNYFFNDSIEINTTAASLTATQMGSAFNAIKSRITYHYGTISGTDKGIRMIDLSEPVVKDGKTKIYITVNAGKTTIEQPNTVLSSGTKWADIGPAAPCTGEANEIIAAVVNSGLGFYLKNATPGSTSPGNENPLVKPNTVVLSLGLVTVNNVDVEPVLPGGPTLCKYRYFDFPTGTTETDPFPSRGEYKIHYDRNANENCFNSSKLGFYCTGNRDVGENLIPNKCTAIGSRKFVATQVLRSTFFTPPFVNTQEHPTIFYYGRVLTILPPDVPSGPTKLPPAEV